MADALIKYETIDEKQIADIMAGREPRPPEDWSDKTPPPKADASSGKKKENKSESDSSLGNPAGEH